MATLACCRFGFPGAIFQDVAQFIDFEQSAQTMNDYQAKFDFLPQTAEGRVQDGSSIEGASAAVLC